MLWDVFLVFVSLNHCSCDLLCLGHLTFPLLTLLTFYSSFKAVVPDMLGVMDLLLFKGTPWSHAFKQNKTNQNVHTYFAQHLEGEWTFTLPPNLLSFKSSSPLFNYP